LSPRNLKRILKPNRCRKLNFKICRDDVSPEGNATECSHCHSAFIAKKASSTFNSRRGFFTPNAFLQVCLITKKSLSTFNGGRGFFTPNALLWTFNDRLYNLAVYECQEKIDTSIKEKS
jgi:hypothetical protein